MKEYRVYIKGELTIPAYSKDQAEDMVFNTYNMGDLEDFTIMDIEEIEPEPQED